MLQRLSGFLLLAVLSSQLVLSASAADHAGGTKSGAGGIMLRAVLLQSVRVAADPQPIMLDSFVTSNASPDLPVTFRTSWVPGPGTISIVVLSSEKWTGVENETPVSLTGSSPVEIDSGVLPFSADNKDEVLIIRAQAL